MSDRLAEIKRLRSFDDIDSIFWDEIDWLIQEVERLRGDAELLAYNVHDGDEEVWAAVDRHKAEAR